MISIGGVHTRSARTAFAQPLYSQVRAQLLIRIRAGEWSAGDALPNEFALASEYGVSVGTIRRAIEGLEEQGVLVRKQGRGTYVGGAGRNPLQEKFTALRTPNGRPAGVVYRLESIARRSVRPREADLLSCGSTAEVIEIEQSVHIDADEIGIERAVVAAAMFPRIETQLVFGQHLYQVYSDYGVLITRATDLVSVGATDLAVAERLGTPSGATLFTVTRQAFSHDRVPVECRVSYYVSGKVSYVGAIT